MVCPEKNHLRDVFAAAIDHHSKTVKALHSVTGEAFNNALKEAVLAQREAEIARLAVEEHRGKHRC